MEYLGEDYKRIVKALIHSDKERKKRIRRGTATAFDIKVDNAIKAAMKELKLYISAGIFIALTAVKMLFPQISDEMRDGISEALKMESEQTQAIIALGSSLTKEDIIKAFDFLRYSETQTVGVDITPMPMLTSNPTTVPTSTPTPSQGLTNLSTPRTTIGAIAV